MSIILATFMQLTAYIVQYHIVKDSQRGFNYIFVCM